MNRFIKGIILLLSVCLILSGAYYAANVYQQIFGANPASSTVLVENGLSGVVSITDPSLKKTVDININYLPLGTGSGVIVTNDGYVLTALHVIADPQTLQSSNRLKLMQENDIKQYLVQTAVTSYLKQNPRIISSLNSQPGAGVTGGANVNTIIEELVRNNLITVKSYKQSIKVRTPTNNVLEGSNTVNANLIDTGDPNTYEDVALLKMENAYNLPHLDISNENPSIGEEVSIYGYPGYQAMQDQNTIKPTQSSGILISRVYNNYGIAYYETDANTANGISGGPAVNTRNEVIGILVYGIQKQAHFRPSLTSDYSLFLSSNYLIDICNRNRIPINT